MKKSYNILCTIAARAGSKGVKNKNIKQLIDKPLIAHTIEQAVTSNIFSNIVISTDSNNIGKIAESYGATYFFDRPKDLAIDSAGKLPVIQHALLESEKYFATTYDICVDLDATSPLRSVKDIQQSLEQFIQNDHDNLITACPARRSPYFNLIEVTNEKVGLSKTPQTPILRRQDSPKCYDMNASIYIWKRDILLNHSSIFLNKTGLYIMPENRSIDIDSEIDFKLVELLMKEKKQNELK